MKFYKLLMLILFISANISSVLFAQGGALSFQNNSYVEVPDNPSLRITNNMTIEAMVYLDDLSNNTIVDKGNYNYLFQTNPYGIPGLGFYNPNTSWIWSAGSVPVNQWVHVAVTIQNGTNGVKFYVNGNLLSQHTMNASSLHSDSGPVNIGRQDPSGCRCNHFHGDMDELRIWNRVRTQAEIQANMNSSLNPASETNLVAYYKFDDVSNCTVIDSKNGFNGTIIGTGGNCSTIPSPISSTGIQEVNLISNSQILNDGLLISSANYGAGAQFAQVNGICFEPNTTGLSNFFTGGGDFYANPDSPELDAVLSGLVFQPNGNASTLTINGLTPGNQHRLQLLFSNDVNSTGNNVNITVEGKTYNLVSWIPSSVNLIVEFTPSASSTVVTFGSNSGAEPNRAVLNAYAIHDLDQPSVSAPCGANNDPVANAGSDQTINCAVPGGSAVTLDGSASSDADGDALTYSWSLNGNVISTNASFTTTIGGGAHTFTLTVSDGQANSTDEVIVTVIVDNVPPVLNLPDDIIVNNDEGECGAIVNFEVTAEDACGGVVVSSTPTSGSLFAVGETIVTCTAVDDAGNSVSGTFKVTVNDNEAPIITLNGGSPVEIIRFGQYNEEGAAVSDNCSSNLTAAISGTVDVNLPGVYTITYSTQDSAGNSAEATREVKVINDPAALTTPYLFLADKNVNSDKNVNAVGDIHSNGKVMLDKGASLYVSNITSVNKIEIKKDVTVDGNITGGNKVGLDKNVTVTGVVTQYGAVNTIPLPELTYAPSAGGHHDGDDDHEGEDDDDEDECHFGENIKVEKNQALTLAPGTYSNVEVKKGGSLTLTGGEYLICKMKLEDNSLLIADISTGAILINTIGDVEFHSKVTTSLIPLGDSDSRYFVINTLKNIKIGKESVIVGSLIAPYGKVHIEKDSYLRGSVIAEDIHVNYNSVLNYHDTGNGILGKSNSNYAAENDSDENIESENEVVPGQFRLLQNYPNPFNPSTTISFALPESGFVTLKVYDILGNEIESLVSNNLNAGYYSVNFDGSKLASGIYIYRLIAGNFRQTNKMIFNK